MGPGHPGPHVPRRPHPDPATPLRCPHTPARSTHTCITCALGAADRSRIPRRVGYKGPLGPHSPQTSRASYCCHGNSARLLRRLPRPKISSPRFASAASSFFFFKLMRETERLVVPFIHAYLLVGSCLCPDPQDPSPSYAEPLEKSLVPATPPTCCVTLVKSLGLAESISSSVKGEPPTSQGHCKNQSYLLIVWNYSQYFFIWTSSIFIGSPLTKTS